MFCPSKIGDSNHYSSKRKYARSKDLTYFPWLGKKGVVQTFKQQDETKIKQRIKESRALFEGADEEQLRFF